MVGNKSEGLLQACISSIQQNLATSNGRRRLFELAHVRLMGICAGLMDFVCYYNSVVLNIFHNSQPLRSVLMKLTYYHHHYLA